MNSGPLISTERVNELLAQLPPRNGLQWGNNENIRTAQIVAAILTECGIYSTYSIGQNLSRLSLP